MGEVFDTIVCVYSSCDHLEDAKKLRDSLSLPNSKFLIFLSKGYKGEEGDGIVKLDIDEGYELLSIKTYKMFEYIYKSGIQFNKIYKIDATVLSGTTCKHELEKIDKIKEVFFNQSLDSDLQYFGACLYTATEQSTLAWAKGKGMSIKGGSWWLLTNKHNINYFSGKFYGLGWEFFNFIINDKTTKGLCNLMVRDWGGCEDMVVGILYQKFLRYDQQN